MEGKTRLFSGSALRLIGPVEFEIAQSPTLRGIYQGTGYAIVVHTNSTVADLNFDEARQAISYTSSGEDGTVVYASVKFPTGLLVGTGEPVVLLDARRIDSTATNNGTHYSVSFTYTQSAHGVLVAGSQNIPTYSVVFEQSGIPSGVIWGVAVGSTRQTGTGPSITVSGLGGTLGYAYDPEVLTGDGTRYTCSSGCSGSVSDSTTLSASYVATTPTPPPPPSPGPCAVSAAMYGSELESQVHYIRHVRDELIGSSPTGAWLVNDWNRFYYSWSPQLAVIISGNDIVRGIFRLLLSPLIGIVHLAGIAFTSVIKTTRVSDLASLIAFGTAASLAIGTYVAVPALVLVELKKWRGTRRSLEPDRNRCTTS